MLWFIRLRRLAKDKTCHPDLLHIERLTGPCSKIKDAVLSVKQAKLMKEQAKLTAIKQTSEAEGEIFNIEDYSN